MGSGAREHGPGIHAGVKLAALATRIGSRRQIAQQAQIEFTAGKSGGKLLRVYAGNARAQSACDHLVRQRISRNLPERKKRLESGVLKLAHAIGANVFEKKIAEGDSVDAFANGALAGFGHALLIDFVRARPGQRDDPEREPRGCGLGFEHRAAHAVHGHAVKL